MSPNLRSDTPFLYRVHKSVISWNFNLFRIFFWENNLNLWDVASGVLLVLEAGGKITQPDGSIWQKNSKNIMASNNLIHEKIIDIINKH